MSSKKCELCGFVMSSTEQVCRKCHGLRPKSVSPVVKGMACLVGLVVLGLLGFVLVSSRRPPRDGKAYQRARYLQFMTVMPRGELVLENIVYSSESYDDKTFVFTADHLNEPDCKRLYDGEYMMMARESGFDRFVCKSRDEGMKWEYSISP